MTILYTKFIPRTETSPYNGTWVFSAPWAHPFWTQYVLVLFDLTTPMPGQPPAFLHNPAMTHETLCYALNPEKPFVVPDGDAEAKYSPLTPANFGYQFPASSDEEAQARMQKIVDGFERRVLSPDTDFRSVINGLFEDGFSLVKKSFSGV